MWTGIILSGLLVGALVVYMLCCVYRESDEDFHPESHAHRGSI
jgi:hypothetical protein